MEVRAAIFIGLAALAVMSKLFMRRAYPLFKLLPIVFIICLAFVKTGPINIIWFAAICSGLLGDALLLRSGGFVAGLLSFLVGHIFYILALGTTPPASASVGVASIAAGAYYYLAKHLIAGRQKKYLVPVFVYVCATAVLLGCAFAFPISAFALLGAAAFAISDFLLAYNRFVRPSSYADAAVSITYYAAQWFLALHFLAV